MNLLKLIYFINKGIGKEAALDLAKRGGRVILACRDLKKANQAASEIREKSGNGNVIVEHLDLASMESIKKFAKTLILLSIYSNFFLFTL